VTRIHRKLAEAAKELECIPLPLPGYAAADGDVDVDVDEQIVFAKIIRSLSSIFDLEVG
jgi:hypothetical protein